jgi:hypothetical protein
MGFSGKAWVGESRHNPGAVFPAAFGCMAKASAQRNGDWHWGPRLWIC